MSKTIEGWRFVGKSLLDGSPIPDDGKTLVFSGEPIIDEQGLFAGIEPFYALRYAAGNTLCRVMCGGKVVTSAQSIACTEHTFMQRMDAEKMLRYFARTQALSVIPMYPKGIDEVVFSYLNTGREGIRSKARHAALDLVSGDSEWAAAKDTVVSSMSVHAIIAARDTALCAASYSAWSTARDFDQGSPEWDAAYTDAWIAAQDAKRAEFNLLVNDLFGM